MVSLQSDGKAIFTVVVGALIAIAFIIVIADQAYLETNTLTINRLNVTALAVNATLDLEGRTLVTATNVTNATDTGGSDLSASGVYLQTGVGSDGLQSVQLVVNDTGAAYAASVIAVTYTHEPDGYLPTLSGRSIVDLIVIFAALGIVVFVLVTFIKVGSLGNLMGRK